MVTSTSRGLVDSYSFHFTDEKAETHRDYMICLRTQNWVPDSMIPCLVLITNYNQMAFNF